MRGQNIFGSFYQFQAYSSNLIFLDSLVCGGWIMMGAQPQLLLLTLCGMIVSWTLYFLIVFPLLPITHEPLKYLAVILCYCNFTLAINTACTDPGIISVKENELIHSMEDCFEHCSYCSLCKIYRPLRARHCRYCNNCILVDFLFTV